MRWLDRTGEMAARVVAAATRPFLRGHRWIGCLVLWTLTTVASIRPFHRFVAWTVALALFIGLCHLRSSDRWHVMIWWLKCSRLPKWQRHTLRWVHKHWAAIADNAGLTQKDREGNLLVPQLLVLDFDAAGRLLIEPALTIGQTVETLEDALERIRVAVGAIQGRVVADASRNRATLSFSFSDPLESAISRTRDHCENNESEDAWLGVTEDGSPWMLPLHVSTLTAGSTGAGKGSVMWGVILDQAPLVATGLVQLQGIDLKGGMELSLGKPLFTRYATEAAEAVVLLEEAAQQCHERAVRLAGVTRTHSPSAEEPTVFIIIDELASLIAYQPDRDVLRRAETALAVLLTQGRAVGFYVFGFLQDPRKEVLKIRNLFTQAIALRLKEREEAAMVLSPEAVRGGAACHRIPRALPGVGFVMDETGQATRVRAFYCDDDLIREMAVTYPAPRQIPIVVPTPEPKSARARTRTERADAA